MARSLNYYNMLPRDAFYQGIQAPQHPCQVRAKPAPHSCDPHSHDPSGRSQNLSSTRSPDPAIRSGRALTQDLLVIRFSEAASGKPAPSLVLSQCGQCAPRQLGPRFRLPGRRASEGLRLWNLLRGGWIYWVYSKRVCAGGRGGKEQLTGPGNPCCSLPGTGAQGQSGKNSSG